MSAVIFHVLVWPTFGVGVLVFGSAPGAVLRLIVLAYKRDDPRRQELLGELYGVPWIERPFWVAEQLEVALFEGLCSRVSRCIKRTREGSERGNAPTADTTDISCGIVIDRMRASWSQRSLNPRVNKAVHRIIDGLATDPRPPGVLPLKDLRPYLCLRVGDYRVIYAVDDHARIVTVAAVGHRDEVYRSLER